jgi:Halocarboxylic acid dehydrogenase DehI
MPAVTFVREADASDERVKEAFRDVKSSLRVSYVDSLFLAYAVNARFLDYTWRRLRPSMLAAPFIEHARKLGEIAERETNAWPVSDHAAALHARNYGDNELRRMREIAELFSIMGPKLLVIANAVKVALSGEPIGGVGAPHNLPIERDKLVRDFRGLKVPFAEEREAPLRVRTIYEDIVRASGAPFVSTEFRAMGAYPDWLEIFWSDCKPLANDTRRRMLAGRLDRAAQDAARQLPYPLSMNANEFGDMTAANDAFCELLPHLVVNAMFARHGLGPEPS